MLELLGLFFVLPFFLQKEPALTALPGAFLQDSRGRESRVDRQELCSKKSTAPSQVAPDNVKREGRWLPLIQDNHSRTARNCNLSNLC